MKKVILFILGMLIFPGLFAQAPDMFNYQGVARDADGSVAAAQNISLRFSVLQGSPNGTEVYVETHSTQTNDFGVFSVRVGDGTIVSGSFNDITWGEHYHYLKTEMDIDGGGNYEEMGTNLLASVPYATYAGETRRPVINVLTVDCESLEDVTETYAKIADVGIFSKEKESTIIEVSYSGRFLVSSMSGTGVIFQFRIDDQPTSMGTCETAYLNYWQGEYVDMTIHGYFPDISPGSHTLSIWAKTTLNTATDAFVDPGCWPDDKIFVKEY